MFTNSVKERSLECFSLPQSVGTRSNKQSLALTVFDLFKRFSENPMVEIGGRQIWSYYKGKLSDSHRVHLIEVTHCCTTLQALLAALFGPERSYKIMRIVRDRESQQYSENINYFEKIKSEIQRNGIELNNNPISLSFAYMFRLSRSSKPGTPISSNHVFLVIQYIDNQWKLNYRLFQSFLSCYDLKTDIDRDSNLFSQPNFDLFLENFRQLCLSSSWTRELEDFYTKFFHTKTPIEINGPNPYFDILPLICGSPVTFDEVSENNQQFAHLKQTDIFQNIISNVYKDTDDF